MSREEQYSIGVKIAGTDYGVFDKFEGGAVEAEDVRYRPGGMASQKSLGGPRATENVTISRLYEAERDHLQVHTLLGLVGKAEGVITKQMLDRDGNAFDDPIVYTGTLIRCTPPNADSESSDAALIELEFSIDGDPS